MVEKTTETASW